MKYNTPKVIQKVLNAMIRSDMEGWPPDCAGWVYQPNRPKQLQREENVLCEKTEKPSTSL